MAYTPPILRPEITERLAFPHGKNSRWIRLVCDWSETKEDGSVMLHRYAACLDRIEDGLYVDDDRKTLIFKSFKLTIGRVFHTVIGKTLYHASGAGTLRHVYRYLRGRETGRQLRQNCFRELKDCVRSPLYGLAMTVMHAASLILMPLHKTLPYRIRKTIGELELRLNYGDKKSKWILAPCFLPITHLIDLKREYGNKIYPNSVYEDKNNQLLVAIHNFASTLILAKKLPLTTPYNSRP